VGHIIEEGQRRL